MEFANKEYLFLLLLLVPYLIWYLMKKEKDGAYHADERYQCISLCSS